VNCPPFPISLNFWVELVGACNSIFTLGDIAATDYDMVAFSFADIVVMYCPPEP
jgi:hypothetical protein